MSSVQPFFEFQHISEYCKQYGSCSECCSPTHTMVAAGQKAAQSLTEEYMEALIRNGDLDDLEQALEADLLLRYPEWLEVIQNTLGNILRDDKNGDLVDLTLEEIVARIVPGGSIAVPKAAKTAAIQRIRDALQKHCSSP
jgi:hypothetical protein